MVSLWRNWLALLDAMNSVCYSTRVRVAMLSLTLPLAPEICAARSLRQTHRIIRTADTQESPSTPGLSPYRFPEFQLKVSSSSDCGHPTSSDSDSDNSIRRGGSTSSTGTTCYRQWWQRFFRLRGGKRRSWDPGSAYSAYASPSRNISSN